MTDNGDMTLIPLDEPTVSVIICAYTADRWDALVESVQSVMVQSRPAKEILLVVDNNVELARRAVSEFPKVHVVEHEGARGHAGASNTGVASATGDVLAFLDDDAAADSNWLRYLLAPYESDGNVLGVGGHLEPRWLAPRPPWLTDEFLWIVGCSYTGLPATTGAVRNLIGANMSLRRDVVVGSGGFRNDLSRVGKRPFAAHETELCIRAKVRWPEGVFLHEPDARVSHRVTADRVTFRYFAVHCHDEGYVKSILRRLSRDDTSDTLRTERTYMTRQLPRAMAREFRQSLLGDRQAAQAAASVLAGAVLAGCGYVRALTRPALPPLQTYGDSADMTIQGVVRGQQGTNDF